MNELERFEKLKKLGYVYEPETGLVKRNGEVRGSKSKDEYIQLGVGVEKKVCSVLAHRYIWWLIHNEIPNVIDHINHITSDNRLINLRNVNKQQNAFNTKAKGYYFDTKRKKYRATIRIGSKKVDLGSFITEKEAEQAYLEAKKIYHKI